MAPPVIFDPHQPPPPPKRVGRKKLAGVVERGSFCPEVLQRELWLPWKEHTRALC